jgi:hypothetical protein
MGIVPVNGKIRKRTLLLLSRVIRKRYAAG